MTKKDQAHKPSRLIGIDLDEASMGTRALEIEHERQVAIFDLLEENHFELADGPAGPYKLRVGITEHRLAFAVTAGDAAEPIGHVSALAHPIPPAGERLFSRLRELLRGDQDRPAKPDRSARHGPPGTP